ncbi:MAG: hypothetical protein WC517_03465 [Patescibacteria group bacterium]
MNPELKKQPEKTAAEAEIDQQIEILKESHPFITKEAYWSALKKAEMDYAKLQEIIAPIRAAEINGYNSENQENIPKRKEIMTRVISLISNGYSGGINLALLADSVDRGAYFFAPKERPGFGEANPIFGAEKLGIPELLPVILVLPEENWLKIFPEDNYFDEDVERFCTDIGGYSFNGQDFVDSSIFSSLGLNLVLGGRKNSEILNSTRHESIHTVDFFRSKRVDENRLLTELVAFRIDGEIIRRGFNKRRLNPLDLFFKNYLDNYIEYWGIDKAAARQSADRIRRWALIAEDRLDFGIVTQLLLNSESIDEFTAGVDAAVEKTENNRS